MHAWGTGCAGRRPAGRARPDGGRVWRRRRRGRRRRHRRRHRRGQEGRRWSTTSAAGATSRSTTRPGPGSTRPSRSRATRSRSRTIEPNADGSNRKELLDSLADEGYGLIFGIGFLFSEDIAKSATESPDTTFAVIDGFADSCTQPDSNLLCLGFKEEEGSFLVGAAAALKTKSNIVGFVGGQRGRPHQEVPGRLRGGRQVHRRPGRQGRQGPGRLRRQHPRGLPQPGQGQGAGPEADRRGRRRHLPRLRRHRGRGHLDRRRQADLRHRGRLRPEPHRQRGRAEVDPHLHAQAGRQRRAADHRQLRRRHRSRAASRPSGSRRAGSTTPRTSTTRSSWATSRPP